MFYSLLSKNNNIILNNINVLKLIPIISIFII